MLTNCPECGKEVSDQAGACPHCGNPINSKTISINPVQVSLGLINQNKKWKKVMLVSGVFLFLSFLMALVAIGNSSPALGGYSFMIGFLSFIGVVVGIIGFWYNNPRI